jgi:hypothetical protein
MSAFPPGRLVRCCMTSLAATVALPRGVSLPEPKPYGWGTMAHPMSTINRDVALEVISEAGVVAVGKGRVTLGGDLDRHLHRRLIRTARRPNEGRGRRPGFLRLTSMSYRMIGRLMPDQMSKSATMAGQRLRGPGMSSKA